MPSPRLVVSLCAVLALGGSQLPVSAQTVGPDPDDGSRIIRQMSERYRSSSAGILIRAEIEKKEEVGSTWREGRRSYRLLQSGDRLRIDLFPNNGKDPIILIRNGCQLLLSIASKAEWSEQLCTSAEGVPIQQTLSGIQKTLLGRLTDLADTNYTVDSVTEGRVSIGGASHHCHRVTLHSENKAASEKWSATLWIDRTTSQVWRADLNWTQGAGRAMRERVTWLETVTGADVPVAELDWKPPANAKQMKRAPAVLPQ